MPYRYTCRTCSVSGERHQTRTTAEHDRAVHRRTVHGGIRPPSGDRVRYAAPSSRPLVIGGAVLLALTVIKSLTGVGPRDAAEWLGLL